MTARTTPYSRRGYTIFELIVVIAIILLLAVIVLPSIGAFQGDTRQRAGSDIIRAELANARSRAREDGKPYRIAISEDGKRIRREADGPEFGTNLASVIVTGGSAEYASGSALSVEYTFEHITVEVAATQTGAALAENGWVTLATVLPDGTCHEDIVLVLLKDEDKPPLYVQVRGLTGTSRVVQNPNLNPTSSPTGGAR